MSAIRLGPNDLLEYDREYKVIICRECQYAIQKSALRSHLLRHKIYRDERERLLSAIAKLDLFEPHQVPLPTPGSLPIASLPFISGYRCEAAGCGNLCASSKRVAQHRREIHGISDPTFSSAAHPVSLQTFFRGTKLRYFEVTPRLTINATELTSLADHDGHHDAGTLAFQQPAPKHVATSHEPLVGYAAADFKLETIIYFHHFTAVTSLTLPISAGRQPARNYWQTDVVHQALQQRWVMCGLLAISTHHMSTLAEDPVTEQAHREQSTPFASQFLSGWEELTKPDITLAAHSRDDEELKETGCKIRCVLDCAQWAMAEPKHDLGVHRDPVPGFTLQSVVARISGLITSGIRSDGDDRQDETLAQATMILKMGSSPETGNSGQFPSINNIPSDILSSLVALPARMVHALEKPEDGRDVLVALSAIACLVECCSVSFASDETGVAWQAMTTWLAQVPGYFHDLTSRYDPGALVVLAHWAALLVKRAENHGCWFLRGSAKMIMSQVTERLQGHGNAVQGLVTELSV